jgi:hypothetical protein
MESITSPAEQKKLQTLLRQVRLEAGLAQEEVAARLERPQSFVSKYETGERRLDVLDLREVQMLRPQRRLGPDPPAGYGHRLGCVAELWAVPGSRYWGCSLGASWLAFEDRNEPQGG